MKLFKDFMQIKVRTDLHIKYVHIKFIYYKLPHYYASVVKCWKKNPVQDEIAYLIAQMNY